MLTNRKFLDHLRHAKPEFALAVRAFAARGRRRDLPESMMKGLAHPSFFRLFDLLVASSNPGLKRSSWTHDGVAWERERHSFTGPKHGLSIEIVTASRPGRQGWSVMIVKEYWWAGNEGKALKALRWAKALAGQRNDILSWFHAQESTLARSEAR